MKFRGSSITRKVDLRHVQQAQWQIDYKLVNVERDDQLVFEASPNCQFGHFHVLGTITDLHGSHTKWNKYNIGPYAGSQDACVRIRIANGFDGREDVEDSTSELIVTTTWVSACTNSGRDDALSGLSLT